MANQIRACPYWYTSSDDSIPISAPAVTISRSRSYPSAFSASATGESVFSVW